MVIKIVKNECYEVTCPRSKEYLLQTLTESSRNMRKDNKIIINFQNEKFFLKISDHLPSSMELRESDSDFGVYNSFVIQYGKMMFILKDEGDEFKNIFQCCRKKKINFEKFLETFETFSSNSTQDQYDKEVSFMKAEEKPGIVNIKSEIVSMKNTVSVRTGKNVPDASLSEKFDGRLSKSILPSCSQPVEKQDRSMMNMSTENVDLNKSENQADGATFNIETVEETDIKGHQQPKLPCLTTVPDIVSDELNADGNVHVSVVSQPDLQSPNIQTLTQSTVSANVASETKIESYKQKKYRQPDKLWKRYRYLKKGKAEIFGEKKSRSRNIYKSSLKKEWKKRKKIVKFKKDLNGKNPEFTPKYEIKYFGKKKLRTKGWSWNYEENLREKYISDDVNEFLERAYEQSKEIIMLLRYLTGLLHHERSWNMSGYVYPTRRGKHNKGNRRNQQSRTHNSQAVEGVQDRSPTQVSDADSENLNLPPAELVVTSSSSTFRIHSSNVPSPTPSSVVSIDSERSLRTRLDGQLPDSRFSRRQEPAKHPEYSDQPSRQRSFTNWPATTGQDPSRMAVYGFFYTGRLDLIRCYMCGIGLKDWAGADEPLFEHIKHSPDCTFLKDLLGQDLLTAYRDNLRANQVQQATSPATPSTGNEGQATTRVRNPQYKEVRERLHTFDKWPASAKQRPQTLADAGLFYTGTNDLCRCYTCDGGLQRWDSDDDPWIEHARWFPHCQFVKQVKGQEYINMVQEAAAQARAEEEGQAIANPAPGQGAGRTGPVEEGIAGLSLEDNSPLNTSAARVVIGMGYSRRAVKLAIQKFNRQAPVGGHNDFSSGDLTSILREMESRGEDLPPDSPNDSYFGVTAAVLLPENSDPEEENRRLRGILRCMQCQENDTNILFLPCTHHRMCEECAEKVVICPVCGRKISEKIKTYLS